MWSIPFCPSLYYLRKKASCIHGIYFESNTFQASHDFRREGPHMHAGSWHLHALISSINQSLDHYECFNWKFLGLLISAKQYNFVLFWSEPRAKIWPKLRESKPLLVFDSMYKCNTPPLPSYGNYMYIYKKNIQTHQLWKKAPWQQSYTSKFNAHLKLQMKMGLLISAKQYSFFFGFDQSHIQRSDPNYKSRQNLSWFSTVCKTPPLFLAMVIT